MGDPNESHYPIRSLRSARSDLPQTLADLLSRTPSELATLDVGLMNLLCAEGLPGAERLDIPSCLATLDEWAEVVRLETERNHHRFKPANSRDTEGFYRCWMLVKTLRDGFGLWHHLVPSDYSPSTSIFLGCNEPGPQSTFRRSEPLFIHGLLSQKRIGSCTSLPVLYAAVGRRLGYPIKLVQSVAHVFIRWDTPEDHFNLDAGPKYINRHPDDYYIDKPKRWTETERASGQFLRPITATEELGLFVGVRAVCFEANLRFREARAAVWEAMRLAPFDPLYPLLSYRILDGTLKEHFRRFSPQAGHILPPWAGQFAANSSIAPVAPAPVLPAFNTGTRISQPPN